MPTLLHIDASPRGEHSISRKLSAAFAEAWKSKHIDGKVVVRDLSKTSLPFVDLNWIGGAYSSPEQHTPEQKAALKPSSLSFEDAASLPIGFVTAASAIQESLQIPLPFLGSGARGDFAPKTVLVLGGSSSVGACAIEILRLALPDTKILTTCSTPHHSHMVSLGATKVFD